MELFYFIFITCSTKAIWVKTENIKMTQNDSQFKIDRIVGGREATTRGLATWTESVNGEELRNYKITEIYNYFDSNKVAPLLL